MFSHHLGPWPSGKLWVIIRVRQKIMRPYVTLFSHFFLRLPMGKYLIGERDYRNIVEFECAGSHLSLNVGLDRRVKCFWSQCTPFWYKHLSSIEYYGYIRKLYWINDLFKYHSIQLVVPLVLMDVFTKDNSSFSQSEMKFLANEQYGSLSQSSVH